jgi:hypothetical protein
MKYRPELHSFTKEYNIMWITPNHISTQTSCTCCLHDTITSPTVEKQNTTKSKPTQKTNNGDITPSNLHLKNTSKTLLFANKSSSPLPRVAPWKCVTTNPLLGFLLFGYKTNRRCFVTFTKNWIQIHVSPAQSISNFKLMRNTKFSCFVRLKQQQNMGVAKS